MIRQLPAWILCWLSLSSLAQEDIEWTDERELTVNDFKAPVPYPIPKGGANVHFGMHISLSDDEVRLLKNFNGRVTNVFSPANSWIDWRDDSRLRYVNTLFDLNEWMTRELRKQFNTHREEVLAGKFQNIHDRVRMEFEKIRASYEKETRGGTDAAQQLAWEVRINDELSIRKNFCKACIR
jgi:hypothetical protein